MSSQYYPIFDNLYHPIARTVFKGSTSRRTPPHARRPPTKLSKHGHMAPPRFHVLTCMTAYICTQVKFPQVASPRGVAWRDKDSKHCTTILRQLPVPIPAWDFDLAVSYVGAWRAMLYSRSTTEHCGKNPRSVLRRTVSKYCGARGGDPGDQSWKLHSL